MAFAIDLHQRGSGDGGRDRDLCSEIAAIGWLGIDRAAGGNFPVERPHADEPSAAGWQAGGGVGFLATAALASGDDRLDLSDLCSEVPTSDARLLRY